MTDTYRYTYGPIQSHQTQVDEIIQQAAKAQHAQFANDVSAIFKNASKLVRALLTLELPVLLSPTLAAPTMVATSRN